MYCKWLFATISSYSTILYWFHLCSKETTKSFFEFLQRKERESTQLQSLKVRSRFKSGTHSPVRLVTRCWEYLVKIWRGFFFALVPPFQSP